jgi:hypothetical protein
MSAVMLQPGTGMGDGVRTAPNGIGAPASFSCQARNAG